MTFFHLYRARRFSIIAFLSRVFPVVVVIKKAKPLFSFVFARDDVVPLETPSQMPFFLPRGDVVSFPRRDVDDDDDEKKRVFVHPYFVVLLLRRRRRRSTLDDDEGR